MGSGAKFYFKMLLWKSDFFFFRQKLTRGRFFFSVFIFFLASNTYCQLGSLQLCIEVCDSQFGFCAGIELECVPCQHSSMADGIIHNREGLLPMQAFSEVGHSKDKTLLISEVQFLVCFDKYY